MQNKKDIPGCFGAVKQTTSIPMRIAILKNIDDAMIAMAVVVSIDQQRYFLVKSNSDYFGYYKKKTYRVFGVLSTAV
jgi:hypothetical protein